MTSRFGQAAVQDAAYPAGHDYRKGSPHLKHAELRARVERSLADEVGRIRSTRGSCRVLEVGAGHGSFTAVLRAAGADVTVTEMSAASAAELTARFGSDPAVEVIEDPDGMLVFRSVEPFDLVVAISVLHHIPDYLQAVAKYAGITRSGGALMSWQDPLWYPRQPKTTLLLSRVGYLAWRVGQGDFLRGTATQIRRFRGILDESKVSDMAEYHVVREGVDEIALEKVLRTYFQELTLVRYWSTQSALLQRVGQWLGITDTFGIIARGRAES